MAKIKITHINSAEFELWYGDDYCDCFTSGSAAIRRAKEAFKYNPDMGGKYCVWANISGTKFLIAIIER